jgi:imidazolonepropionase-like amidohydrolase
MKKGIRRVLRTGLLVLLSVGVLALLAYWAWFRNPYHDQLRLAAATVMTLPADRYGLLIRNANLVDVDRGVVVPDVTVRVRGETIDQVSIGEMPEAEAGFEEIDARGKYLMPGLFDTHVHLGNGGIAALDDLESEVSLEQFVLYGVTTILSVGGTGGNDEQISDFKRRERRGEIVAPRIFGTGDMLTVPGSHPVGTIMEMSEDADPQIVHPSGVTIVKEGQDLTPVLRRKKELGLDGVKIVIESGPEPFYPKPRMSLDLATQIVREANVLGLPVFVHISSGDELADAVRSGARAAMHSVHDTLIDDAEIELMRSRNLYYVPTLSIYGMAGQFESDLQLDYVSKLAVRSLDNPVFRFMVGRMIKKYEGWEVYFERAKNNLARLHAAGVPIALGSDTNNPFVFPGCSAHLEMELMAQAGLSNADILRIVTLGGAELLGVENEIGKVGTGYLANLIVLEENPLEDLRNMWTIDKVVLKGRVIELPVGVVP